MDMTYKEYMGESFHMWHNGADLSDHFTIIEVTGRSLSPNKINSVSVPGMLGTHFLNKRKKVVPLKVKAIIRCDSDAQLRQEIDNLNGILDTENEVPIQFSDEQNKTYFGILSDISEGMEMNGNHIVTITFWRSSPYKYGPEQTKTLTGQGTVFNVPGTAEAKPIFELDVTNPITFAMVSNGTDYMMIGSPAAVTESTADKTPKIFHHAMEDEVGWVSTSTIGDGYINGTMKFDASGFYPAFAAPSRAQEWHGPALKHSMDKAVQDFQAEAWFRYFASDGGSVGRLEMYGLDDTDGIVFRAWIEDKWYGRDHIGMCLELGNADKTEYLILPRSLEDFYGRLEVYRQGNEWTLTVKQMDGKDNVHRQWNKLVISDYQTKVSQMQVAFQTFYDQTGDNMEIFSLRLYEYVTITGVPYIAQPGDKLLLDFENDEIRLNGDMRKDLKTNLGAKPFNLLPGDNVLALLPDGDISGKVRFRPAHK